MRRTRIHDYKRKVVLVLTLVSSTLLSSWVPLTDVLVASVAWVNSNVQSSEALAVLEPSLLREHRRLTWILLKNSSFAPLTPSCIGTQSTRRLALELFRDCGGLGILEARGCDFSESSSDESEMSQHGISNSSTCISTYSYCFCNFCSEHVNAEKKTLGRQSIQ